MHTAQRESARRWSLERLDAGTGLDVGQLARRGLTASPKTLPPVLFYDARGSALFESICRLEEYAVTRTERAILAEASPAIAALTPRGAQVAELGSGSSEKTALLLEALLAERGRLVYVPIDVSESALAEAGERLTSGLPGLEVRALVGEYQAGLDALARRHDAPRLLLFLGSNLGNFDPPEALAFLHGVRRALDGADRFLLGLDLVKDPRVLEAAYDDRAGVTAAFNANVLVRLRRELGAGFDPDAFVHRARWNAEASRVEMHLVSRRRQRVPIEALGLVIDFAEGESIHTESSHKYTLPSIARLAARAGFEVVEQWTDARMGFAETLLAPR
jgi:L-histidine N-alpha-methyltransferase